MSEPPLISIIIAVKNAAKALQQTLDSLRIQDYPNLEIIVIDGNSTDATLNIIQDNNDIITSWVSESDQGISDAFNKGLTRARGQYINFQGAGDTLITKNVLSTLFNCIEPDTILLCGKVARLDEDTHKILWIAPKTTSFNKKQLLFKMALPHQGLFTHRSFFERFGQFDTSLRFAMDYELLLRAYRNFPKTLVKDVIVANWRTGGVGSNRILEIFDEYHLIKSRHHVASKMVLKLLDSFTRLKYFLKTQILKMVY